MPPLKLLILNPRDASEYNQNILKMLAELCASADVRVALDEVDACGPLSPGIVEGAGRRGLMLSPLDAR